MANTSSGYGFSLLFNVMNDPKFTKDYQQRLREENLTAIYKNQLARDTMAKQQQRSDDMYIAQKYIAPFENDLRTLISQGVSPDKAFNVLYETIMKDPQFQKVSPDVRKYVLMYGGQKAAEVANNQKQTGNQGGAYYTNQAFGNATNVTNQVNAAVATGDIQDFMKGYSNMYPNMKPAQMPNGDLVFADSNTGKIYNATKMYENYSASNPYSQQNQINANTRAMINQDIVNTNTNVNLGKANLAQRNIDFQNQYTPLIQKEQMFNVQNTMPIQSDVALRNAMNQQQQAINQGMLLSRQNDLYANPNYQQLYQQNAMNQLLPQDNNTDPLRKIMNDNNNFNEAMNRVVNFYNNNKPQQQR